MVVCLVHQPLVGIFLLFRSWVLCMTTQRMAGVTGIIPVAEAD